MKKIIGEGLESVPNEVARTKKMMGGKISDLKKTDLQQKLNVLRSFTDQEEHIQESKKDEL